MKLDELIKQATPGDWVDMGNEVRLVKGGDMVCLCHGFGEVPEANTKLICHMHNTYAHLVEALEACDNDGLLDMKTSELIGICGDTRKKARNALLAAQTIN